MKLKGFKRNRSLMKHDFSQIPSANIPRSSFNRSHGIKTAFDSAYLVPILVDEVLPGDTFNVKLTSVARLITPIVPVMDNIFMDFFFFFVPNRLLWSNFQRFMGERDPDPDSSIDYTVPQISTVAGGFTVGSLADYFGLPIDLHTCTVNSLHFRAYNLIWNEWFRDENLQDSVTVDSGDGPDTIGNYVLLKRNKRHDYFTSCLPWPQKGDDIELPLGSSATVHHAGSQGDSLGVYSDGESEVRRIDVNSQVYGLIDDLTVTDAMYADLSSATASSINELREAFQLQRLLERDARGGTRYTEIIKAHFRVDSPDARLQRPEYLGGGSSMVQITPIAQTSETNTTEQGTLAAVGYCSQSGVGFTKSFVEHGVILGLVNVRADLTYQQGRHRMWDRQTKYDFYWPALAHLGEQEVLNSEIYFQAAGADANVFGYQERWAEYRYKNSQITGILRSQAASSMDVWHLSQEFGSLPELNSSFITEAPPIDRITAINDEPEIIFDGYFSMICTRPMPTYSVPGLIDHF